MGTIKRRFDSIKIESNDHNRRAYRDMLFTTKGIEEAISGVILSTKPSEPRPWTARRFPSYSQRRASCPASKSIKGR
jgi:fructose-bisphosphate aldolase class I